MALSKLKLKKIREEQILQNYQNTLKKHTKIKSLRKVAKNHLTATFYTNEKAQKIISLMNSGKYKNEFSYLLTAIAAKGKTEALLQEEYMLDALACVAKEHAFFIRDIKDWKPKARNAQKLFASLVRHLFAKYYVPSCMDALWFDSEDKMATSWFIDVGQGKNVSKSSHFPVPLTKKEAHHFIKAPSQLTFIAAIRYGQAKAVGANTRFANNLIQTDLGKFLFPKEEFWKEVIAFLVRQRPTATAQELEIVIEYIWTQKFARIWGENNQGQVVRKQPANPNFELKGRTWESLWRNAYEWFKIVGFIRQLPQEWAHFIVRNNYIKSKTGQCFVFEQLLTHQELFEEGKKMNHCVGSYTHSCKESKAAIFSMRNVLSRESSIITLEVSPKDRKIVQAKRRFNAAPTAFEIEIIKEWAKQNELKLASDY